MAAINHISSETNPLVDSEPRGFCHSCLEKVCRVAWEILTTPICLVLIPLFITDFLTSRPNLISIITILDSQIAAKVYLFIFTKCVNPSNYTYIPIMHSVRRNREGITKTLVEAAFPVDPIDEFEKSPLELAFEKEQYATFEYLLEQGADISRHGEFDSLLGKAVRELDFDKVQYLVQKGARIYPRYLETIIRSQAEKEKIEETLSIFFENATDVEFDSLDPSCLSRNILYALRNGLFSTLPQMIEVSTDRGLAEPFLEALFKLDTMPEGIEDLLESILSRENPEPIEYWTWDTLIKNSLQHGFFKVAELLIKNFKKEDFKMFSHKASDLFETILQLDKPEDEIFPVIKLVREQVNQDKFYNAKFIVTALQKRYFQIASYFFGQYEVFWKLDNDTKSVYDYLNPFREDHLPLTEEELRTFIAPFLETEMLHIDSIHSNTKKFNYPFLDLFIRDLNSVLSIFPLLTDAEIEKNIQKEDDKKCIKTVREKIYRLIWSKKDPNIGEKVVDLLRFVKARHVSLLDSFSDQSSWPPNVNEKIRALVISALCSEQQVDDERDTHLLNLRDELSSYYSKSEAVFEFINNLWKYLDNFTIDTLDDLVIQGENYDLMKDFITHINAFYQRYECNKQLDHQTNKDPFKELEELVMKNREAFRVLFNEKSSPLLNGKRILHKEIVFDPLYLLYSLIDNKLFKESNPDDSEKSN